MNINTVNKLDSFLKKSPRNRFITFSKPLTPDEAIDAFKKYIDSISVGKNRDNIRIIQK